MQLVIPEDVIMKVLIYGWMIHSRFSLKHNSHCPVFMAKKCSVSKQFQMSRRMNGIWIYWYMDKSITGGLILRPFLLFIPSTFLPEMIFGASVECVWPLAEAIFLNATCVLINELFFALLQFLRRALYAFEYVSIKTQMQARRWKSESWGFRSSNVFLFS